MPNILTWNQTPGFNTFVVCSEATERGVCPCATDEERAAHHRESTFDADPPEKFRGGPKFTADAWASQCATEALRLVQAECMTPAPEPAAKDPALLTIPKVL